MVNNLKNKIMEVKRNLIAELISALNGEAYEDAASITEQIKATGNTELIKQADYLNSVL